MATIKQKRAARIILENTGKSIGEVMEEVGYKPGSVKNPQQLTKSIGFQELLDKYLPEEDLTRLHKEQLEATSHDRFGDTIPDNDARLKALDMGYKLRGNYKPSQLEVRSFVGWTPQELEAYAATGNIPERFVTEG